MFILNGRLEENKTGSPTSRNSSVIDYALSSTHFLYNICKLEVLNFCKLFSDVHSPLSLQLYTNNEIKDKLLTETFCCGDERVNKWKNEKCNEYKNNIDRNKVDDICNRLSAYVNDVNNVTKYDMNNIVTDICDTLTESAKATFGTSTFNKTMFKCSKNQFSKDWYNKDCKKAQREFRKSKRLYKHYGSNIFKERLRQSELHYKKVMDIVCTVPDIAMEDSDGDITDIVTSGDEDSDDADVEMPDNAARQPNPWFSVVDKETFELDVNRDFEERIGPCGFEANFSPVDYFDKFLKTEDDDLIDRIVDETNRYANQCQTTENPTRHARSNEWSPVRYAEMRAFIGLVLAMGIVKKSSIESYWEASGISETPNFRDVMSRNRFQAILRYLHCNDNTTAVPRGQPGYDPLHKINPVVEFFNEVFELNYRKTCSSGEFTCDSGQCIHINWKCDGEKDCYDSTDELKCNGTANPCTINNGGCDHICNENGESKDLCSCRNGYKLEEKTRCVNIDECTVSTAPICSQLCNDKQGTYECECIEGYNKTVVAGATTCKVNGPRPWLLLANRNDIRKFVVGTWFQETLVDGLSRAVSVDFYKDKYVYWSDVSIQQIARETLPYSKFNLTDIQIVRKHLQLYSNIFRSEIKNGKMIKKQAIKKATIIDNDLDEPRGIALDPIHGYFYMTDWGKDPKIERIGMDGSNRKIITNDVVWPNAITIDYIDSRIFWIDAKLHTIMSADLDGSRIRTVLHNNEQISHPFSMAVFEDNIFWTDWAGEDIRMAHKYTGKHFQKTVLGLNSPMGIKVYHESLQNSGHNVCDDIQVNCEYLCLPKPRVLSDDSTLLSYTCVCPDNKNISHNGHTCVPKDMDTTEVTTMTTSERTVTDNNNILTTQSSAESQSTSMTTLRADKSKISLSY
ncbi:VLDLR [Mytilus edulis]|uniref:VLDLR n=1 Tax=Mytilus edulis TaxID=6550 RepID=A0A8S3U4V0_MYTED|nr:VLDLR [Mytilus edulis]